MIACLALLIPALVGVSGCTPGTAAPAGAAKASPGLTVAGPAPSEPPSTVSLSASDGVHLTGRWYGRGSTVIVLAHMGNDENSQDDWAPLARTLAGEGWSVLTFNRRGVCSPDGACSDGPSGYADAWKDVVGAIAFARAQGGTTVVAGGASIGATASLYAVAHAHAAVEGLMWVAGTLNDSWSTVDESEVRAMRVPLLVICATDDRFEVGPDATTLAGWANQPVSVHMVPGRQHGTELWTVGTAAQRAELDQVVVTFVRGLAG